VSAEVEGRDRVEWIGSYVLLRHYLFALLAAEGSHGLGQIAHGRLLFLFHLAHPRKDRVLTNVVDAP